MALCRELEDRARQHRKDSDLLALALQRLRARVSEIDAAQWQLLEAARTAIHYGATPAEVELITGHWPKAGDL